VTDDAVTRHVSDDGIGLAHLPRRAPWHGGTLSMQPEPDGGTRLTWAVPRPPSTLRPRPLATG
jgi:signal transduction histidine kinase